MVLGSGIRYLGSGKNLFRIPDPGSRGQKAPNPGYRIRIRNTGVHKYFSSCRSVLTTSYLTQVQSLAVMDFSIPLVPLLNPDQETRPICHFMRGCGVDYNDFDFVKEN